MLSGKAVQEHLDELFGEDVHAKRVMSLANGVIGVMHAAALAIHAIGKALAVAMGLEAKHTIKQVDRLLSNDGIELNLLMRLWLRRTLAGLKRVAVALDWTDFDKDNQSTLALHLVTTHGRSAALMWWTVTKEKGKKWRGKTERAAMRQFAAALPEDVQVVLLADRGFGSQDFYELLTKLGIDFIIRFKDNVTVETAEGIIGPAANWVPKKVLLMF